MIRPSNKIEVARQDCLIRYRDRRLRSLTLACSTVSEAAVKPGVDVSQIAFNTPANLPSFDDKYQRHIGVLDTFEGA
jgi:hypothetical protein